MKVTASHFKPTYRVTLTKLGKKKKKEEGGEKVSTEPDDAPLQVSGAAVEHISSVRVASPLT